VFPGHNFGMDATPQNVIPMQGGQAIPQASSGRREWPELLDTDANEAKARLETETGKTIYLVPKGSMVTMDYSESRVRIFFDKDSNKVVQVPRVG